MKILGIAGGGVRSNEEAGVLADEIAARGHELCWASRLAGDALPADDGPYDGLILFGGEISVADPEHAPYFNAVAALIHKFDDHGKPVLGSCLGAQTVAYAFGGEVRPLGFLEFGFTTLSPASGAADDPLLGGVTEPVELFELHSDTFSLPPTATLLMQGGAVTNQAFRVGKSCYGFQCHFEATPKIADAWIGRELRPSPRFAPGELEAMERKLEGDFKAYGEAQTSFANNVVDRWLELCAQAKAKRELAAQVS
ncbi:MAG: type 1 glutamine amidotransferase [Acidocella sp.]|nr:type 1 glutamine amidotransferase [Acidocella sp.]